jgi:transposase
LTLLLHGFIRKSVKMEVKMAQKKVYDKEFKVQAVKLGREIGFSKAAKELGINVDTLYGWSKAANEGRLDLGPGTHTPQTAMSLTEELQKLRQENREQAKLIQRLKEENEFLAEASAFFAASRRKSPKT